MSRRLRICSGLQWMPKIRKTVLWICAKQGKIKEGEEGKMEKVVQPVRHQTIGRGSQKRNEDQKERVQKKKAAKMMNGLKADSHEEQLKKLCLAK